MRAGSGLRTATHALADFLWQPLAGKYMACVDPRAAQALARQLMDQHFLNDWRFVFDDSRRRFGICRHGRRTIGLSRPLTLLNGEAQVRDTILHEVSHALAGGAAGHGPAWKAMAKSIGARPQRCYSDSQVATPVLPYRYRCPVCGQARQAARRSRSRRSCGRCSPRFNESYLLNFESNPDYARPSPKS